MALTDTAIRHAKPGDKPVKLSDEKGLYLLIHPNGGKWWRFEPNVCDIAPRKCRALQPKFRHQRSRYQRQLHRLEFGVHRPWLFALFDQSAKAISIRDIGEVHTAALNEAGSQVRQSAATAEECA